MNTPTEKGEAVDPQILQADGGGLHHAVAAAGVGHAAQIHLYIVAHGGGVVGLDELLAHEHPNGANDTGLVAGGLQDGANHIGGGGLALGACHADDGDVPLCGVLKESGAQQGQGLAGIRHQDHLGARGASTGSSATMTAAPAWAAPAAYLWPSELEPRMHTKAQPCFALRESYTISVISTS